MCVQGVTLFTPIIMSYKIYGLIGKPLGHSFSACFFNKFFQENGIDAEYVNFELEDIGQLMEVIAENPDLAGLNVTIPYKEQVIPYMHALDPTAERVGAVNVIQFSTLPGDDPNFLMKGFNTDVAGFVGSVKPYIGELPRRRSGALVLGTGGVSKAIREGLLSLGFSPRMVSRNPQADILGYKDITAELLRDTGVIANATPVGMWPKVNESLPLPYAQIVPGTVCFDAVYNPEETLFLKQCAKHGGVAVGGSNMLHIQAREAWKVWNETIG